MAAMACKEDEWNARERQYKLPAGRPRLIASMFEVTGGIHEELAAGQRPVLFALSWLGHFEIETGALLAEPVA